MLPSPGRIHSKARSHKALNISNSWRTLWRKRNFRNSRLFLYDSGDPDSWIIMERTSSDEIFLAIVLANRWMERSLGTSWSFIKNFALRHKRVSPLFPTASTINPEVARSGLFSEANTWRNQVSNWFLKYLHMAIRFRIASTLANVPIFSRISPGSMEKGKESFDTEIDSEANIKGLNSICIFSGEEDTDTSDICFDEEEALPMF